jgi:hypothetical protein
LAAQFGEWDVEGASGFASRISYAQFRLWYAWKTTTLTLINDVTDGGKEGQIISVWP